MDCTQEEPQDPDLADLESLLALVRHRRAAIGAVSPRRIRLWVLWAIARVRAAQERRPNDLEVERTGGRLAVALSDIMEKLWPGGVWALQRSCDPGTALADLGLRPPNEPPNWRAVAEIADETLEREIRRAELDEDGWADADMLDPPPRHPKRLLGAVRRTLETHMGPIRAGRWDAFDPQLVRSARDELRLCALQLRWLRGSLEDADSWTWGLLAGRLRFVHERMGHELHGWAGLLDAERGTERPWARRVRNAWLRRRVPGPGASPAEVRAWLQAALELHALRNPEIARLLRHGTHVETVLALDDGGMDRRARRRLRCLQEILRGPGTGEVPERYLAGGEALADGEALEPAPGEAAGLVPAPLLERTRGRRLLLCGNRRDPHLERVLAERLGLGDIRTVVCTWRRVSAARQAIRQRSVDLVVVATGFVGHMTYHHLRRACDLAGLACIEAERARPAAIVRAMTRDLGIVGGA